MIKKIKRLIWLISLDYPFKYKGACEIEVNGQKSLKDCKRYCRVKPFERCNGFFADNPCINCVPF